MLTSRAPASVPRRGHSRRRATVRLSPALVQAELHHASVTEERDFVCTACGLRRRATVVGVGEGAATVLNDPETGPRRAREAAAQDVADTLALAVCPACGARDARAKRRWWWKHAGLPAAIMAPIIFVCAFGPYLFDINMREEDKRIVVWVVLGIFAFVGALVALPIAMKWKSAGARVKWQ